MKNLIVAALFSAILLAGCLGIGEQPTATPTATPTPTIEVSTTTPTPSIATATPISTPIPEASVSIINRAFKPSVLEISVGTKVVWKNEDGILYTINAEDKSFGITDLRGGATFEHVFDAVGEYKYSTERFGFGGTIKVS